ncbi:PA2169 family four-helix-bundle protein [Candidatus Nitrospira bockiana]
MATTNEQVIETLNRLLAVCKASEQGFRAAAEAVKENELRTVFKQYSHQRGRLASELRMEIRLLGGEPEMLNGIAMPTGLDRLVAASVREDEQAVLAECSRMEETVIQAFEKAMEDGNIPLELVIALRRQSAQVREAFDRITGLAKAAQTAPAVVGGPSLNVA